MKLSSELSVLYLCNLSGEDLNNRADTCILSAYTTVYVYRSIRNVESCQDILFKFSFQEIKIFPLHTMKARRKYS